MRKSLLIISFFLTLSLAFLPIMITPVRADSTFYDWNISHAQSGENTDCNNFYDVLGTTTTALSGFYYNHDGIRDPGNSWSGKTLTSVTLYIMRLSGSAGVGIVTFGSFSSTDGSLIASLATIPYASLPVCVSSPPVSTTISGLSYLIPSGAYLGWSYSGTAQDNVVDYFDYNSGGGNLSIPSVTEYDLHCSSPPPGSCASFENHIYSPFFGTMSETSAAPPSHTALYTTWAPIVAIMVVGMALFGLTRSKGTSLIVIVISLAVILGFVSVIMGVWS